MLMSSLLDYNPSLTPLVLKLLESIPALKGEWSLKVSKALKGHGEIGCTMIEVESVYGKTDDGLSNGDGGDSSSSSPTTGATTGGIFPKQNANETSHGHDHSHEHSHSHTHSHDHSRNHSHSGPLRTLPIIKSLLQSSPLPPWIIHKSLLTFTLLALAESNTHRTTLESVHFHEVGAIDSLIDVIGTISTLYLLNATSFSTSPIPFSEGTVFTDHGILPIPAPATAKLMVGFKTCEGPKSARGELVTPTGMAVLKALTWDYRGGVRGGGERRKRRSDVIRMRNNEELF